MPAKKEFHPDEPLPFWSGTITFGLVSVPVDLYSSTRSSRVSMRMLAKDGTPLKRKYFCSGDEKALQSKQIVRGYEKDDGSFVLITDDELEQLAPRKSRDIDLRLFVDRNQIPVSLLQRSYVLAPGGDSTKAYHLLAATIDALDLAGVATFVMRGKEYLTAIVAEKGLLRASTLHFADEIRSPQDIGLPSLQKPSVKAVSSAKRALKGLAAKTLNKDLLQDQQSLALLDLAERKRAGNTDVVESGVEEVVDSDEEPGNVVDIMALLRKRMGSNGPSVESPAQPSRAIAVDLEKASKETLYQRAQQLDLPGRSSMTKDQLVAALKKAG